MRIKAYVNTSTGKTKHYSVSIDPSNGKGLENISAPKWIEISEESDGFHLYHFGDDGICIADTWHETLEDAKEQATFEFDIKGDDWKSI